MSTHSKAGRGTSHVEVVLPFYTARESQHFHPRVDAARQSRLLMRLRVGWALLVRSPNAGPPTRDRVCEYERHEPEDTGEAGIRWPCARLHGFSPRTT